MGTDLFDRCRQIIKFFCRFRRIFIFIIRFSEKFLFIDLGKTADRDKCIKNAHGFHTDLFGAAHDRM